MELQSSKTYNHTFTSRCPMLRDADWVCRKANSFQHTSVTKFRKQIMDYAVSRGALAEGQSIHCLKNLKPEGTRNMTLLHLYHSYKRFVEKFNVIRKSWDNCVLSPSKSFNKMVEQYKNCRMSNCGEDAFLAAAIVKMNYFENVYTACFTKDGELLGHQVCIFNKDGSEFSGEIKPFNTIIIDPWLQKTDFANLLLKEYKTTLKNFIDFEDVDKIEFAQKYISKINFSGMDVFLLRIKYPEFTFPYRGRSFLHNFPKKKKTLKN